MSLTDPIANMLTNIRNALQAKHESVDIPASKVNERVLQIFKDTGYIEDYRLMKNNVQGTLKVYLKYTEDKRPAIIGIKRISKPGLRVYKRYDQVPRVLNGLGTAVISTSKGVIDDKEARRQKVGGEIVCYIW